MQAADACCVLTVLSEANGSMLCSAGGALNTHCSNRWDRLQAEYCAPPAADLGLLAGVLRLRTRVYNSSPLSSLPHLTNGNQVCMSAVGGRVPEGGAPTLRPEVRAWAMTRESRRALFLFDHLVTLARACFEAGAIKNSDATA